VEIRLGDLREIGRQGAGWRPRPPDGVIITPSSIRSRAIRLYHDEGLDLANQYLEGRRGGSTGLSGYFGSDGPRAQQGQRTREAFNRYVHFDGADGRPVATMALSGDVSVGHHVIGATVDIVVFGPTGYGGRVLNWDIAGINADLARLVAVPALMLIDQELGHSTCSDIEVWDLEHGVRWPRDSNEIRGDFGTVARLLDRVEANLGN
jgi:hypothetical protein